MRHATRATRVTASIEAVVFDVDGTLYEMQRMRLSLVARLLREAVLAPTRFVSAMRVIRSYRQAHERIRGERNADLGERQLRMAAELCGRSEAEVATVIHRWFEALPLGAVAAAGRANLRQSLARLRERGVRTAVLSDYPAREKLRALGVEDAFDFVAWAQMPDIGSLKPDPKGLEVVLARLGVSPDRAVYVGDRLEVDVAAAEAAGCIPVLIGGARAESRSVVHMDGMEALVEWVLDASSRRGA